jgi:hypothetical protein
MDAPESSSVSWTMVALPLGPGDPGRYSFEVDRNCDLLYGHYS